ncbi:MAG TPA: phosphoribosyltransferase family protein, partial [Kofleriaceae bacterium]|nr:phosphoribosyltransferase family protein [Kofleriaceae bacterium]
AGMSVRRSQEEGIRLARALGAIRDEGPFVLGIAREGVLAADAVARELHAPLDVLVAGQVLAPGGRPIGGIAEAGALVFDEPALARLQLTPEELARLVEAEHARLDRQTERIRGSWPLPPLADRTVVIVDDAMVTGLTMRAAVASVVARRARRVVVAVALSSIEASRALHAVAHDVFHLEWMTMEMATRVHRERCLEERPPPGDAEIHDLIVQELTDVGTDPFEGLAIDGM